MQVLLLRRCLFQSLSIGSDACMKCLTGKVVSEGVAVGNAHILRPNSIVRQPILMELEKEKFKKALFLSTEEIKDLIEKNPENEEYLSIQTLLLEDPLLSQKTLLVIEQGYSAFEAITKVIEEYIELLMESTNSYLKERTFDLADIRNRIIRNLDQQSIEKRDTPYILICEELHPSILIQNRELILGVLSQQGGYNSHGAILCRQFNIPYMIAKVEVEEDSILILDTRKKSIKVAPEKEELLQYQILLKKLSEERFKAVSHEGFKFLANVSSNIELDKVVEYDFDGIGLYRTEMIFMNSNRAYTLEEQYEIYLEAFEKMQKKSVCFRTFDIGDDKQLTYVKAYKKGIDNYIQNPELFKTQIEALLRANRYNTLKIMFPMIYNAEEFKQLKQWVQQIQQNIHNHSSFKLGIMLETKEALDTITSFSEVDFISIGTNDLIASIYHVDREQQKEELQAYLNDLLFQLKKVIRFCDEKSIELSICGELAAIEPALKEFIKAGVKNFSVAAPAIKVLNHVYKEFN